MATSPQNRGLVGVRVSNPFARLLELNLDPESFVRQSLQRLETEFREMTLLAFGDWTSIGVVAPELFHSVASLQRPSWGMWNGLITSLKKARTSALRNAGDDEREQIESAGFLRDVLHQYEQRLDGDIRQQLQPLAELCRASLPKKLRLGAVLTMPISLRNRIAHDAPSGTDYWNKAADAIRTLIEFHADNSPLRPLLDEVRDYPSPWFHVGDNGAARAFNGFAADMSVIYVDAEGESTFSEERTRETLIAFQTLLGKTDAREDDFRSLLSKLAPEDIRGVMLGDYLVGRPVGSGGFATVHVGCQLSTGRKVAVKIMHDGQPERMKERFQQEARFLSQLDHPYIVHVYGYGEETWSAPRSISLSGEAWFEAFSRSAPVKNYIAMEWVEGETLNELFHAADGQRDDWVWHRQLAEWFSQAAEALSAVHNSGLVHRDIKPANLMVNDQSEIRLMDFGIARWQDRERTLMTTEGTALGTPAYMSPEQIRAADIETEVGPPSDIYSLCATFYELFSGRRIYDHDTVGLEMVTTRKLSGEAPPRPRLEVSRLPWEVETIVMGGLQADVKDRYESMDALKRDVQHFLQDEPIEYKRPSVLRRMQLGYRRHRTLSNIVAVFLMLAIAGTTFYIRDITKALAAQEAANEERAEAEVEALQHATPEGCRVVLQDIRADYALILPRLRQLLTDPQLTAAERHRIELALLQHGDLSLGDNLFEALLVVAPGEAVLIRDVLTEGKATRPDEAWEILSNSEAPPAKRLRAAAALAAWAPADARWEDREQAEELAAILVRENTRSINTWLTAFHPVRDSLVAPLSTIFADTTKPSGQRLSATVLLSDFAAEQTEHLAWLAQVADAEQIDTLYPVLAERKDKVIPIFKELLEQRVYRDPPIPEAWPAADKRAVATIESATGMVTQRFALAESLTREQLRDCISRLASSFYRPTRVRGWRLGEEVRYAVIWTRDAREFRIDFFDSAKETRAASEEPGFSVVDATVAAKNGEPQDQFALLRVKSAPNAPALKLELTTESSYSDELMDQDFRLRTMQRGHSADGKLYIYVYYQPKRLPAYFETDSPESLEGIKITDVYWSRRYGAPINEIATDAKKQAVMGHWIRRNDVESETVVQAEPELRRQRWRDLAASGYEPWCIDANSANNSVLSATGWHRRLVAGADRDALARRQANAAALLLRLEAGDTVWPTLEKPENDRLISLLIHRVEPFRVPADVILQRLQSEQDIRLRRALVLALGEYPVAPTGAVDRVRAIFQNDADAGMHSAAEWCLRQWNSQPDPNTLTEHQQQGRLAIESHIATLKEEAVDPATAEKTQQTSRNWIAGPHGHSLVTIPGPVVFDMGAPATEPGWQPETEYLYKRIIPRGFAIATREVTLFQFEKFVWDYGYSDRWGLPGPTNLSNAPAYAIPFRDAALYCNWLSAQEGLPKDQWCYVDADSNADVPVALAPDYLNRSGYRLPTHAEWEYACRAGSSFSRYYGDADELLDHYAWHAGNAQGNLHPVGLLKPNAWGLFDMLGNGGELCSGVGRPNDDPLEVLCLANNEQVTSSTRFVVCGGSQASPTTGVRPVSIDYVTEPSLEHRMSFRVARTWQTRESQYQGLSKVMQQGYESTGVYLERARAAAAVKRYEAAAKDFQAYTRRSWGREGLMMTDNEFIIAPRIPFDEFESFTIEAIVSNWGRSLLDQGGAWGAAAEGEAAVYVTPTGAGWTVKPKGHTSVRLGSESELKSFSGHLAIVFDGQQLRAYANGKLQYQTKASAPEATDAKRQLIIGSKVRSSSTNSFIEQLRVSRGARYEGAEAPMRSFQADDKTEMHLDFRQYQGARVPDLSGNGNQAMIRNAWWLPPSNEDNALSKYQRKMVTANIVNRTGKRASMFLLEKETSSAYGAIEPGKSSRWKSWAGNRWEARFEGREPIQFVFPDKSGGEIILE